MLTEQDMIRISRMDAIVAKTVEAVDVKTLPLRGKERRIDFVREQLRAHGATVLQSFTNADRTLAAILAKGDK
jgi:hypothetical protein